MDDNNKLILTIKEEQLDIISSEDLQFMIICFKDKYNTGNLEKINTVYDTVITGYIYENIIFVYFTEFGTYFLILNKKSTFPCKLYRQSDEVNLYNLFNISSNRIKLGLFFSSICNINKMNKINFFEYLALK